MMTLLRQYKGKPGYGNGDARVERLYGGLGNDLLNGGGDADYLYGDDGNDTANVLSTMSV
jgi:hypothetical protein